MTILIDIPTKQNALAIAIDCNTLSTATISISHHPPSNIYVCTDLIIHVIIDSVHMQ